MARYIDADKLKEKLKELRGLAYSDFGSGMLLGNEKAQAALEMMPTADVVEVKHGEWIDTGDEILDTTYSGWKCSECGYVFCGNKFKFCPHCGAKMDVSKKETSTEVGTE